MAANQWLSAAGDTLSSIKSPDKKFGKKNVGTIERVLSIAGGALLAYYGFKQKKNEPLGIAAATLGSSLLIRGASGYCPMNQALKRDTTTKVAPVEIIETFTIYKYRHDVYNFWRHLENLPQFMKHLSTVRQLDNRRSHWEATIPGGLGIVEWEAEIVNEQPNTLLAWRSLPGSEIENHGEVVFSEAPGGKGTEVQATIYYRAPAGAIGKGVANLLHPALAQMVREDLRRFKQLMESGEISTINGQPSGRES